MADMQLCCLLAISRALGFEHLDTYLDPLAWWQICNYGVYLPFLMHYGLNTRTLIRTLLHAGRYVIMVFVFHFSCIRIQTLGHAFGPSCKMADMSLWCVLSISHAFGFKHPGTYLDPLGSWQICNYGVHVLFHPHKDSNTQTLIWTLLHYGRNVIMVFVCKFSCITFRTPGHLFGLSCMMVDM